MKTPFFLVLVLLTALATGAITHRSGVAVATSSTVNGVTPISAINGQTIATGGGFEPDDVAGLLVWLEGDRADVDYNDNEAVATWEDKHTSNADATQATGGNQPTLQTNEINGHAVLRFDGGGDNMIGTISITGTTATVFAVMKMSASTQSYGRVVSLGVSGTNDYGSAMYAAAILRDASTQAVQAYRNSSAISTKAITYDTAHVISSVFDGTNHTTFVDGVGTTPAGSTGTFGITGYRLGQSINSGDPSAFAGDVAEILIYSGALNSTDRQAVEDYLGAKYSITVASSGAHQRFQRHASMDHKRSPLSASPLSAMLAPLHH